MGQVMSQGEAPPPVVLVPPLFERDLRLRVSSLHAAMFPFMAHLSGVPRQAAVDVPLRSHPKYMTFCL